MKHLEGIEKLAGINSSVNALSKLAEQMSILPHGISSLLEVYNNSMLSNQAIQALKFDIPKICIPNIELLKFDIPVLNIPKFDFINSAFLETLENVSKIGEQINNHPEYQFAFISNLEALNLKSAEEFTINLTSDLEDEDIIQKEELLSKNLLPYLEELQIDSLWIGASQVLKSESNPDKLRHCLISIRTILEFLIDEKLAPIEELKNAPMFEQHFKKYHLGKQKIELVKVKRAEKIEYFTSKIDFGVLEQFTKDDIKYVCDCYSILCNVHQPNIGITENQVRSLKVKTGITIWLLAYINKVISKSRTTSLASLA